MATNKFVKFIFIFFLISLHYISYSTVYKNTYFTRKEYPYSTSKKYNIEIKEIRSWDPHFLYEIKLVERESKQIVYKSIIECLSLSHKTFKFSPDNTYLFIQPDFFTHQLLDIKNKKILFENDKKTHCAFSSNGKFLCLEHNGIIELFCAKKFKKLKQWEGESSTFKHNQVLDIISKNKKISHNLLQYKCANKLKKKLFKKSQRKQLTNIILGN